MSEFLLRHMCFFSCVSQNFTNRESFGFYFKFSPFFGANLTIPIVKMLIKCSYVFHFLSPFCLKSKYSLIICKAL